MARYQSGSARPLGNVTVRFAADNSTRILVDNASVTTGIYIVPDSWSFPQIIEQHPDD